MIYYVCAHCGSRLSRFDGGWRSTRCPQCGQMAAFDHMGPSGQPVDYHRPVGVRAPSVGWVKTSSRKSRGGRVRRTK